MNCSDHVAPFCESVKREKKEEKVKNNRCFSILLSQRLLRFAATLYRIECCLSLSIASNFLDFPDGVLETNHVTDVELFITVNIAQTFDACAEKKSNSAHASNLTGKGYVPILITLY